MKEIVHLKYYYISFHAHKIYKLIQEFSPIDVYTFLIFIIFYKIIFCFLLLLCSFKSVTWSYDTIIKDESKNLF